MLDLLDPFTYVSDLRKHLLLFYQLCLYGRITPGLKSPERRFQPDSTFFLLYRHLYQNTQEFYSLCSLKM
jgi:hypothetical protein